MFHVYLCSAKPGEYDLRCTQHFVALSDAVLAHIVFHWNKQLQHFTSVWCSLTQKIFPVVSSKFSSIAVEQIQQFKQLGNLLLNTRSRTHFLKTTNIRTMAQSSCLEQGFFPQSHGDQCMIFVSFQIWGCGVNSFQKAVHQCHLWNCYFCCQTTVSTVFWADMEIPPVYVKGSRIHVLESMMLCSHFQVLVTEYISPAVSMDPHTQIPQVLEIVVLWPSIKHQHLSV